MAVSIFWGDFEHNDPVDFLYKLEMLLPVETEATDEMMLNVFNMHLKTHSEADLWWGALPTAEKDTWEHLCDAFEKEWLRNGITPRPTPSPPQYQPLRFPH